MADFAPPPGPPPPKVPEGWKAIWNTQYNEWFYVNTHTKQSQWDKPTEPVYGSTAPDGPPGYDHSTAQPTGPEKGGNLSSNNPYAAGASGGMSEDEKLARKLQGEENARSSVSGNRGANDGYYGQGQSPAVPSYGQQSYAQQSSGGPMPEQDRGKKGGFLSKITSKLGGGGSSSRPYQQQGYGGGYPQQYPQQGYGGYPQQAYGGGYGQPMYGQPPHKSGMGGMGMAGGAALGLGAGVLGGALIANEIDDHQQDAYQDGYQDGQDGGDYGGGDDGGGDF